MNVIDPRKIIRAMGRSRKMLRDEEIAKSVDAYRAWRAKDSCYADFAEFSKTAPLDEVSKHGLILTPGRYACSKGFVGDRATIRRQHDVLDIATIRAALERFTNEGRHRRSGQKIGRRA